MRNATGVFVATAVADGLGEGFGLGKGLETCDPTGFVVASVEGLALNWADAGTVAFPHATAANTAATKRIVFTIAATESRTGSPTG